MGICIYSRSFNRCFALECLLTPLDDHRDYSGQSSFEIDTQIHFPLLPGWETCSCIGTCTSNLGNATQPYQTNTFFCHKAYHSGQVLLEFRLLVHDFMLQPSWLSSLFPNLDVLECLAKRLLGQWFRGDVPGAGEDLKGCRFWICKTHKSTTRFLPGCQFLELFRRNGNVVRCLDQYFSFWDDMRSWRLHIWIC